MENKYIDIYQLTNQISNPDLKEKYIRYICGWDKDVKFHQQEIDGIEKLLTKVELNRIESSNFLYGYIVPQLGKEFDLIKVSQDKCVNIELKSDFVALEKIKKQLIQNRHYINLIGNNPILFTYVSKYDKLFQLVENEIVETSFDALKNALKDFPGSNIDLDNCFIPNKILVSPLNSPKEFIDGKYLLTDQQQVIKNKILNYIKNNNGERFFGLTGGPGTGKTLLIYDIAKELSKTKKVLIVHSGIKCDGHNYLERNIPNIRIIAAKELRLREIKDVDLVVIDESHRLYSGIFEKAERWTIKAKSICLFSFDSNQKMSKSENRRNTDEAIKSICGENIAELTGRIRTNKNIALFIKCLFDLSKCRGDIIFNNVQILFEKDKRKAVEMAKSLETKEGYKYISYTPSSYNASLDYQDYGINTHKVIGQEYDNVVMILNDYFMYDGNILSARSHPNPDYIFPKLLFQGLTRARNKICLIVMTEELLLKILRMFEK